MRRLLLFFSLLLLSSTPLYTFLFSSTAFSLSAADTVRYEMMKAMPIYYQQMKEQLDYPLAWQNAGIKKFGKWKQQGRSKLMELMENMPPAPASYDMEVVAEEQRDGYKAQKILFNVSAWCRIPAYLLVPDGDGPFPGLVALHDHGAHFTIGKEKMVKPFGVSAEVMADADDWTTKCYDGVYVGDYYAQHGFVVLAIDALFWGERGRKEGADYDAQQALASNCLQMGTSWGAIINIDDMRSAEFLASLPCVSRVGCFGHSMGSYRSWMLAAMTDVVEASANICWMNDTEHLMTLNNNQNRGGSAYSMLIPGLRRWMDYPHVASLACPKPTLFFNGRTDKLFPVEGCESAYAVMHEVWQSQQADERLITKLWDEKHYFNKAMQAEVLGFFEKWLK